MYNIFKVYDHENEEIKQYTIREISNQKKAQMEDLEKKAQVVMKKTNGPLWLRIIAYISILVGIILLGSVADAYSETQKTTDAILIVLVIGIAIFLIGVFAFLYLKNRSKKLSNETSTLDLVDDINKSINESYLELNVPSNAITMDILFVPTKVTKDGKEKHMKTFYNYLNKELKVFIEDDNLCFSDNYRVIALKLDTFKNILKINKRIIIPLWNKEKSFKDDEYKDYKVRANGNGLLFVKPYYSVKHELNDMEYEFLIPNYELDNFLKLLPLEVIDNEEVK